MRPVQTQQSPGGSNGSDDEEKVFKGLQARFALAGHQLHRTNPADGPVAYYSARWGLIRALRDLDEAREFLRQISGAA